MNSLLLLVTVVSLLASIASAGDVSFTYNGFRTAANLSLDGLGQLSANGLLILTNRTKQKIGHAFYSYPIRFKNSSNSSAFSFSTTFVFAIHPQYPTLSGHGIAFVIAPTRGLPGALPSQHLGLFSDSNNGNDTNHVVAVEFDTILNEELGDINDNHVGIDINGLRSKKAAPAGYYTGKNGGFKNLSLISGKALQAWVDYNGLEKKIEVRLAPRVSVDKPDTPLLSLSRDLSPILNNTMYVGFSSSTGSVLTSHYVLGWSFRMNGQAQPLAPSKLPKLPPVGGKKKSAFLTSGLPVISVVSVLAVMLAAAQLIRRKRKFAEELEDWELDYGPHRFKYKDLYFATKGFKDKELLGSGGFGRVYRGVLPTSKLEIAVKRISHESRQGMKAFIAEVVSIGRLRHRNIVSLLGYCRRKGELLFVGELTTILCLPNI